MDKERVPHQYKDGDNLFIRRYVRSKLDEKYDGPFKILSVRKNGSSCLVDEKEKIRWHSIRHLKPWTREDVGT